MAGNKTSTLLEAKSHPAGTERVCLELCHFPLPLFVQEVWAPSV